MFSDKNRHFPEKVNISEAAARCQNIINGDTLYIRIRENGINYGPFLQPVEHIKYTDNQAVVYFNKNITEVNDPVTADIQYVDALFQSLYVFRDKIGFKPGETLLPYKMKHIVWNTNAGRPSYAFIRKSNTTVSEEQIAYDLFILDEKDKVILEIHEFTLMRINRKTSLLSSSGLMGEISLM